MGHLFSSIFTFLFDLVVPPRGTEERVQGLTLAKLQSAASGESSLPYRNPDITALVWELKYRRNPQATALAGEFIAEELMAIAAEELGKPLLIPVPMHAARRRERGYNQTEMLCEASLFVLNKREGQTLSDRTLSQKVLGSPVRAGTQRGRPDFSQEGSIFEYAPNVLVRARATPPQQGLPRFLRLKNIRGAMQVVDPERVRGRVCVVVDDVTTTGATFEECKRVLKLAGARAVHCVALARS